MVGLSRGANSHSASLLYLHPLPTTCHLRCRKTSYPLRSWIMTQRLLVLLRRQTRQIQVCLGFILIRNPFTYHNASELKLSRKREREVSVEPVTTPTASNVLETRYCFLLSVYSLSIIADRIRSCYIVNGRIPLPP